MWANTSNARKARPSNNNFQFTARSVTHQNENGAKTIGALAAKHALEKGIKEVVFDRGGARYHGKVKALADAAREAGLKF